MSNQNVVIQVSYQVKSKDKTELKMLTRSLTMSMAILPVIMASGSFVFSQKNDRLFDFNKDILFNIQSSYVNVGTNTLHLFCKINHLQDLTVEEVNITPLLTILINEHQFTDLGESTKSTTSS